MFRQLCQDARYLLPRAALIVLLIAAFFAGLGLLSTPHSATRPEQIGPNQESCPDLLWLSMNGCQPPPMVDRDAYAMPARSEPAPGWPRLAWGWFLPIPPARY